MFNIGSSLLFMKLYTTIFFYFNTYNYLYLYIVNWSNKNKFVYINKCILKL